MTRLIVTSDWHADWVTDGFERHRDLEHALEPLMHEVRAGDYFLHLGDLSNPYSKNVHIAVSIAVDVAVRHENDGVESHWIVGNHDVVEDKHGSHTMMALEGLAGSTHVHAGPGVVVRDGVTFIFLPYTAPSRSYDPVAFIEGLDLTKAQCERVVVAGHLNIEGITAGSETHDMPRGRDVFFPLDAIRAKFPNALMLNGHYHERQCFRGIHIPGSLLRLTHGEEENEPGYLVIEL